MPPKPLIADDYDPTLGYAPPFYMKSQRKFFITENQQLKLVIIVLLVVLILFLIWHFYNARKFRKFKNRYKCGHYHGGQKHSPYEYHHCANNTIYSKPIGTLTEIKNLRSPANISQSVTRDIYSDEQIKLMTPMSANGKCEIWNSGNENYSGIGLTRSLQGRQSTADSQIKIIK